jgi:hypothetical protein
MMESVTPLDEHHPDFIEAVEALARIEADGVGYLVNSWMLRLETESAEPISIPQGFLLAIAVSLRFKIWEQNQHRWHIEAGLPSSDEILSLALLTEDQAELGQTAHRLHLTSLRLFHDHFVWHAKATAQIDLAFENPFDEQQLKAVADFIWNNRRTLREKGDSF